MYSVQVGGRGEMWGRKVHKRKEVESEMAGRSAINRAVRAFEDVALSTSLEAQLGSV